MKWQPKPIRGLRFSFQRFYFWIKVRNNSQFTQCFIEMLAMGIFSIISYRITYQIISKKGKMQLLGGCIISFIKCKAIGIAFLFLLRLCIRNTESHWKFPPNLNWIKRGSAWYAQSLLYSFRCTQHPADQMLIEQTKIFMGKCTKRNENKGNERISISSARSSVIHFANFEWIIINYVYRKGDEK